MLVMPVRGEIIVGVRETLIWFSILKEKLLKTSIHIWHLILDDFSSLQEYRLHLLKGNT